jgi:hypothetical protein
MGKLYDRQHGTTRVVPQWEKPCPDCGLTVSRDSALLHLSARHDCMFRVEGWMEVLGMPEESFDELLAFIRKLKSGGAWKEAEGG